MAPWVNKLKTITLARRDLSLMAEGLFTRDWITSDANKRVDLSPSEKAVFQVLLIRPTRYDDDGYASHWGRALLPSNSLACMNGIALDCAARSVLGDGVEIRITVFDESADLVDYPRLIRCIQKVGHRPFLCLVGVQSNQFPRAMDIAQYFLAAGAPVCVGGFHVSGCLSMLHELPAELKAAQEQGISLFSGEAEAHRFDAVLADAWAGKLQPIYRLHDELVELSHQPLPTLPIELIRRNINNLASIDLGRGCPYRCSYCCIINVQGRKSRSRSVDGFEHYLRHMAAEGVSNVFITDDNFARNQDWETYFDRLILLRKEGIKFKFMIQVDTLCHRIPRFIDKAVAAGVGEVFVGLENINPDNLSAVKKHQNKITEYREMLLHWKRKAVIVWGAYIIGMPNDTRESILRDIEIIKRELPIDIINLHILTPLPGSEDHRRMLNEGEWMDPDLNKYDLARGVIHHRNMTDEELNQTYSDAWDHYYTFEHMQTVLRRAKALGSNKRISTVKLLLGFGVINRIYNHRSYDMGLWRRKRRALRRPGMPLEPALLFYPKHYIGEVIKLGKILFHAIRLLQAMKAIWRDPAASSYRDTAISPVQREELDNLDLFQKTRGGLVAVEFVKRRERLRAPAKVESS